MGGEAFSDTRRLTPQDLQRVAKAVIEALEPLGLAVLQPAELSDKSSHGDVDFVVSGDPHVFHQRGRDALEQSQALGGILDVVRNGHLTSFLTGERFQVDLDWIQDPDQLQFVACVTANSDFVWILQKSLAIVRLLLTVHGLFLRVKDDLGLSKKDSLFLLSTNSCRIAEFLRIPATCFDGKTSLTNVQAFEAITASRFFHPQSMLEWREKETSKDRRRIVKRPMVQSFLQWLDATLLVSQDRNIETADDVVKVAPTFFGKQDTYASYLAHIDAQKAEEAMRARIKAHINGDLVMQWCPTLEGKNRGVAMSRLREVYGGSCPKTYAAWLESTPQEEIRHAVEKIAKEM